MSDVTVDPEQARDAKETLKSEGDFPLNSARWNMGRIVGNQDHSKWGDQPAPQQFQRAYTQHLTQIEDDLKLMETQFDQFIQAVDKAVTEFERTDSDVAAQAELASQYENQATEVTEAAPAEATGYGATGTATGGNVYAVAPQ